MIFLIMPRPSVCSALYRAKENLGRIRPETLGVGPPQTPMDKLEAAMSILNYHTGKCGR